MLLSTIAKELSHVHLRWTGGIGAVTFGTAPFDQPSKGANDDRK
jgi:hypothetical protein